MRDAVGEHVDERVAVRDLDLVGVIAWDAVRDGGSVMVTLGDAVRAAVDVGVHDALTVADGDDERVVAADPLAVCVPVVVTEGDGDAVADADCDSVDVTAADADSVLDRGDEADGVYVAITVVMVVVVIDEAPAVGVALRSRNAYSISCEPTYTVPSAPMAGEKLT